MSAQQHFSIASVSEVFREEITARSGVVNDAFHDATRLFARSVLPGVEEVRPGDRLQGGVALRATESDIWLHPYVFRQVCSNGAIMAHSLRTRHLTELDLRDPWDAEAALREAIQDCCEAEAFTESVREFRSATEVKADLALNLLSLLSRSGLQNTSGLLCQIMDQFFGEPDRTRFGLTNAVTAVARGTRDPETRWRLEELGGAIAAGLMPSPPSRSPGLKRSRRRLVSIA